LARTANSEARFDHSFRVAHHLPARFREGFRLARRLPWRIGMTDDATRFESDPQTAQIIGAAIEVHRTPGCGYRIVLGI